LPAARSACPASPFSSPASDFSNGWKIGLKSFQIRANKGRASCFLQTGSVASLPSFH
jgi:hypothetical protein